MIVCKIENGLERGFVKNCLNCVLLNNWPCKCISRNRLIKFEIRNTSLRFVVISLILAFHIGNISSNLVARQMSQEATSLAREGGFCLNIRWLGQSPLLFTKWDVSPVKFQKEHTARKLTTSVKLAELLKITKKKTSFKDLYSKN